MTHPSIEEQRRLVRQWETTGRELDRMRREALKDMPYNWREVVALLQLGDDVPPNPHNGSGLVEMQRCFLKAAPPRDPKNERDAGR